MTNSPASSSESSAFSLLDRRIQRWIWSEGWAALRDIQEVAIPAILPADRDVIISAPTAGGKTEAAFFPIISRLLREEEPTGAVLYVSPLKALINDQWERLEQLCRAVEIPVVAWHGDVPASRKHRFLKNPRGVLLITPESLEALFVIRGSSMPFLTASVVYVVVDELHSFIGSERGKQLQSLMHRVETSAGRMIPRIGLSATLGDMHLAAEFLRPEPVAAVTVLESRTAGQQLKVLIKSYGLPKNGNELACSKEIASDLFTALRGSNNLVFPNRRSSVELYTDLLRQQCEQAGVPNEFWAHHGNLSRELREETEHALKSGPYAATAICTSTLELGIDIGAVKSIAQIGPPPSVSGLRQRLGRSGRRAGEPAILRCFCDEAELTPEASISDRLREGLVQTAAMIRLLLKGWFEPPDVTGLHASTFIQQVLSVVAERGGASVGMLWSTLVQDGPFGNIDKESFLAILKEMGVRDLLVQDRTGLLLHGGLGEKLVNSYDFYAAFVTDDEFTLQHEGHTLGSLPISRPLVKDQRLIFGGRRWRVIDADDQRKVISVVPDPGGAPPMFDSAGAKVHNVVRNEMRAVLASEERITFLDERGQTFLAEARRAYRDTQLNSRILLADGNDALMLSWSGDKANDALCLMLSSRGYTAWNEGLAVRVHKCRIEELEPALRSIGQAGGDALRPDSWNRAAVIREKWDWALPFEVLVNSFISSHLDVENACLVARNAVAG